MADVVTTGATQFERLTLQEGVQIRVRTPGLRMRFTSVPAPDPMMGAAEGAEDEWDEAFAANDLEPLGAALEAVPAGMVEDAPIIGMDDSPDAYADIRAQALPGESLLVFVETNGVVQGYAPVNASQAMAATFGPAGIEAAAPPELQFQIPVSVLAGGGGPAGFGEGVGGAIVRFFRVKVIDALIDAPVRFLLDWIIDKVEKKAKPREGFRFFRHESNYPFVTPEELRAMGTGGQRVLLLTHGIFSSLPGAFAGIADPGGPVMTHLRGIYGNNIIGWDHWTVGKTPLENAEEMLRAIPPGIRPDLVCHSRGALVTRAMLEHPQLIGLRQTRFPSVGKSIYVAGANQGSQLASLKNINRLLNIYSAVAAFPALGGVGVALKVIVGVLKVLAHGATSLPAVEALSPDVNTNAFLGELNKSDLTPTGEIVVVHANYDPSKGPLQGFLDLNVDLVFGEANDMVVPYTGAATFDAWQQKGTMLQFGTPAKTQSVVMHTNFFQQPDVKQLIQAELV